MIEKQSLPEAKEVFKKLITKILQKNPQVTNNEINNIVGEPWEERLNKLETSVQVAALARQIQQQIASGEITKNPPYHINVELREESKHDWIKIAGVSGAVITLGLVGLIITKQMMKKTKSKKI
jgi:DNA phosphorothioation-dependent restriction protein DptG